MLSRSNIIWFSGLLFLLLVSAGYFMLRILPVMREAQSLSRQFQSMLSQRRELVSRPEGPPSETLLRAARDVSREKEMMLQELEAEISIEAPELLPEGITRPSIYWLDTLRRKRLEISSMAEGAGLEIPPDLGFADGLPPDARVPELLFRLYVTEELIEKAAESGLRSISDVRFQDPSERDRTGTGFRDMRAPAETGFRDMRAPGAEAAGIGRPVAGLEDMRINKASMNFSIESSLENVLVFINSLRDASFIYNVEDMRFEAVEVERVEVEEPGVPRGERPPAGTRRRDEFFEFERAEERTEIRIVERFLRVDIEASLYYIPEENGAEITTPWEGAPGAEPPDEMPPPERRRIIR